MNSLITNLQLWSTEPKKKNNLFAQNIMELTVEWELIGIKFYIAGAILKSLNCILLRINGKKLIDWPWLGASLL